MSPSDVLCALWFFSYIAVTVIASISSVKLPFTFRLWLLFFDSALLFESGHKKTQRRTMTTKCSREFWFPRPATLLSLFLYCLLHLVPPVLWKHNILKVRRHHFVSLPLSPEGVKITTLPSLKCPDRIFAIWEWGRVRAAHKHAFKHSSWGKTGSRARAHE